MNTPNIRVYTIGKQELLLIWNLIITGLIENKILHAIQFLTTYLSSYLTASRKHSCWIRYFMSLRIFSYFYLNSSVNITWMFVRYLYMCVYKYFYINLPFDLCKYLVQDINKFLYVSIEYCSHFWGTAAPTTIALLDVV